MNSELLTALERIEREKGISKEVLFEAIESALVSAARKVIDDPDISKEDITVTMDKETGEIKVYSDGEEVDSALFGRIAAQTAKQVIIQKIREAERDVIFGKYLTKVGNIISGAVHRFEKGNIIVELDDTEAVLPKSGQIPRERFRQGEQLRAYLLKVDRDTSGPEIILSRTDPGFVRKLFELEVPEITQGIVEIKAIAREAGERTKMAVHSKDERVDPVGACVGMRGSRVRDIVKELHGERIDIVRWDSDIREYLPAAVSPSEILKMVIDRENNTIKLTVPQDQLALLIGKRGRNIRLASRLVEWELLAEAAREALYIPLSDVKGITKKALATLEEAGYDEVDKVLEAGVEGLAELDGVGEKTAEKILASCEEANVKVAKGRAEELAAAQASVAAEAAEAEKLAESEAEEVSEGQSVIAKENEEKTADEPAEEAEEATEEAGSQEQGAGSEEGAQDDDSKLQAPSSELTEEEGTTNDEPQAAEEEAEEETTNDEPQAAEEEPVAEAAEEDKDGNK